MGADGLVWTQRAYERLTDGGAELSTGRLFELCDTVIRSVGEFSSPLDVSARC
jgi:hypothetical protein